MAALEWPHSTAAPQFPFMPLTQSQVVKATAREKTYRLLDSLGLHLEVAPAGGKWWRVKYQSERREKRLSLGVFPAIGVHVARPRCIELRAQVAAGVDPSALRKTAKQLRPPINEAFEAIAREWHENSLAAGPTPTPIASCGVWNVMYFPASGHCLSER
jgi:hypothetical protein